MANLIVNGIPYDMDKLSDAARAQVTNLEFVEAELTRLQAQVAVYQTAKMAYLNALKPHLALVDATSPKNTH